MTKVYRFKAYDIATDENILSKHMATRDAIQKARGEAIEESEQEVPEGDVDSDGFYRPKG